MIRWCRPCVAVVEWPGPMSELGGPGGGAKHVGLGRGTPAIKGLLLVPAATPTPHLIRFCGGCDLLWQAPDRCA